MRPHIFTSVPRTALEAKYVSAVFVYYNTRLRIHVVSTAVVYYSTIFKVKFISAVFMYYYFIVLKSKYVNTTS